MTLIPCSLAGAETLQNGAQAAARPQAQVWDGKQQGGARVACYLEDKGARGVFTFGSFAGASFPVAQCCLCMRVVAFVHGCDCAHL